MKNLYKQPSVSLCIPSYNSGATLRDCLKSVMKQTYPTMDVVVVDDGSSDDTVTIARCFDVKLLKNRRNLGIAASRNAAIEATKGELFLTLDADIVIPRDWVSRMVSNFQGRRKIAGCCGKVVEKYTSTIADRWRGFHMPLHFGNRRTYSPRFLLCGIAAFRRDVLEVVGGYDVQHKISNEDVDLSNRVRDAGYDVLYDPLAIGFHLKRNTPDLQIRGFWIYWASQNERDGDYRSLAAASRLLVRRQIGIADFRLRTDLKRRNDDFLALDLLIPLTFCVRDLDRMAALKTIQPRLAKQIQLAIAEHCLEISTELLPAELSERWAALAFGKGSLPTVKAGGLTPAAKRYVDTFADHYRGLLGGFSRAQGKRIVSGFSSLMKEARRGGRKSITAWQELV